MFCNSHDTASNPGPASGWRWTSVEPTFAQRNTYMFLLFRTRHPISLNEWHDVRLSRTGRDGTIQVDKEAAIHGMSKGGFTQLTLTLDLFIGGHRNFDEVAQNANADQSFKGCIQKVSRR